MVESYVMRIATVSDSHAVNMLGRGEDYERSILSDEMNPYK